MKKILTIFALFLTVALSAQYTVKYEGKTVMFNGKQLRIQANDIPVAPLVWVQEAEEEEESTSDYVYADADSIEVIKVVNFDEYTAQEDPLTSYIEGIMPSGSYLGGDTGSYYETIAFVDLDGSGDIILRSDYREGYCCTEGDYYIDAVSNSGTGVIWREPINSAGTPRDTAFLTIVAYFPKGFAIGEGMKFNGLRSQEDGDRDSRVSVSMFTDYDGSGIYYTFYDYGFDDATDADKSAKVTLGASTGYGDYPDEMPTGDWVSFTTLHYGGTVDNYDNMRGYWVNDTCQNWRTGVMQQNTADGDYAFDQLNIETHFGGADSSYNSPRDQSMYIYSATVWKTINGYSMYPDMTAQPDYLSVLKLPEETGWPVTTLPEESLPYADSVDIIMDITFDDMNAVAYNSHRDSITQAFDYLNYVGAEDDYYFQTLAIVDAGDGDMALESNYPEGECCTESDDFTTGTSGLIRAWWDASHTEYEEIMLRLEVEFEEGFTIAEGMKFPGVRLEGGAGSQRLMIKDSLWLQFYDYPYSDAADTETSSSATYCGGTTAGDTIESGVTYVITQRFVVGASDTYTSIHEVFLDNEYVDSRTGLMWNNSATTEVNINSFDFSFFMGGASESYFADHTETTQLKRITAYKYKDSVTSQTTGNNQSATDRVLPDIL